MSLRLSRAHLPLPPPPPPSGLTKSSSAIILDLTMIVHPKDVVRDDGRHLAIFREPNLRDELLGLLAVLRDPKILILWPAMFVGEMCLALVSSINGTFFPAF